MNSLEQTIALLEGLLLNDLNPDVRVAAIQNLARLGCYSPIRVKLLYNAAHEDPSPRVRIAAAVAITDLALSLSPAPSMSEQPKVQMTFNAPVYGAVGRVEGDQVINVGSQEFDALLSDYKQFIDELRQKYPAQVPEAALPDIVDAEFREIQKTQPQRWQNFLNLKRLWNGGKKATFKVGEHFTEDSLWGKAALAFLEGVAENPE